MTESVDVDASGDDTNGKDGDGNMAGDKGGDDAESCGITDMYFYMRR